jgi:hydroxypyruvate isomerase
MFKLSYNTNGLRTIALADAVREIAAAGYDGIELSLHPSHLDPFRFNAVDAARLRSILDGAGLTACSLATGADNLLSAERFEPSLIHPSETGRQRRIDLISRAVEIAVQLGVPVVSFASGIRRPEVPEEAARELLYEGIGRCLDRAAGEVVLAIEPEPEFLIETNGQAVEVIERLGSPGLRLNQDVGHANVCEDDYLTSIERALPLTRHIHVEDIKGRVHRHEIPGEGDIDFPALLDSLRRGGYGHYLSVELYNHGDVYPMALRRSLRFLRELMAQRAAAGSQARVGAA